MAKTTACPCKDCGERVAATKDNPQSCHANCEKYNEWRVKFTAYQPDAAIEMQFDTIFKIKRRKHLKKRR